MHAVSRLLPVSDEETWLFLLSDEESPRNALASASSRMSGHCGANAHLVIMTTADAMSVLSIWLGGVCYTDIMGCQSCCGIPLPAAFHI